MKLKPLITAAFISLPAGMALAQQPSYFEGGITPEKYYSGGASDSALGDQNLKTFDTLDFEIFSNQEWDRLQESHADDIVVTWPDGSSTVGIERHIADLKKLFVFAPDTEIKLHPVRIASGDWTAVAGVMTGTFTESMPVGDGTFIEPTGQSFELPMSTIAFWQNGEMVHEWLFWDNATYLKQLGIGN